MSSSMGSTLVGSAVKNERIMGQKLMCYEELAKRGLQSVPFRRCLLRNAKMATPSSRGT